MPTHNNAGRVRIVCHAAALIVGDLVLTPSRQWETVTGLDRGEAYSRSTRVVTAEAGPDYPWVLLNRRTVHVRRRQSAPLVKAA